jgi:hypothetical protein
MPPACGMITQSFLAEIWHSRFVCDIMHSIVQRFMDENQQAPPPKTGATGKRGPASRRMSQKATNLMLAAVAGQAGCATLLIVFTALFIGLWLDSLFEQRGPWTFGLLILSVPVSLYVMLRLTLSAIRRIIPQPNLTATTEHEPPDFTTEEV